MKSYQFNSCLLPQIHLFLRHFLTFPSFFFFFFLSFFLTLRLHAQLCNEYWVFVIFTKNLNVSINYSLYTVLQLLFLLCQRQLDVLLPYLTNLLLSKYPDRRAIGRCHIPHHFIDHSALTELFRLHSTQGSRSHLGARAQQTTQCHPGLLHTLSQHQTFCVTSPLLRYFEFLTHHIPAMQIHTTVPLPRLPFCLECPSPCSLNL